MQLDIIYNAQGSAGQRRAAHGSAGMMDLRGIEIIKDYFS